MVNEPTPTAYDMVAIVEILRQDYARFPKAQTFEVYAADVYFKDPTSEFRGLDRYRQTIAFIDRWFQQPRLDLREIGYQAGDAPNQFKVRTEWTLHWTTPLPWSPRIAISGWSDLVVVFDESEGNAGKIICHIDGWYCSGWDVVQQHFPWFAQFTQPDTGD